MTTVIRRGASTAVISLTTKGGTFGPKESRRRDNSSPAGQADSGVARHGVNGPSSEISVIEVRPHGGPVGAATTESGGSGAGENPKRDFQDLGPRGFVICEI